jgi:hypothetical protein
MPNVLEESVRNIDPTTYAHSRSQLPGAELWLGLQEMDYKRRFAISAPKETIEACRRITQEIRNAYAVSHAGTIPAE